MKKLAYVLIVFILVGAAAGAYWVLNKKPSQENIKQPPVIATSTQTVSLETKTYRNDEFGFEFQYPKDLILKEKVFGNYYSKFNLEIFLQKQGLDSVFLLNIVLPKFVETDFWKSNEKDSIVVGGIEGKIHEYEYEGFAHTSVILPFGEYKIILATGDGEKQYLDEFNQILSSFKFLK